jgi:hypothetical protein
MIGPLVRVAASAAAARSLRTAAHDAVLRAILTVSAAAAVAAGAVCLTTAALLLLERAVDGPAAWALMGAFWTAVGLIYFAAARRRR